MEGIGDAEDRIQKGRRNSLIIFHLTSLFSFARDFQGRSPFGNVNSFKFCGRSRVQEDGVATKEDEVEPNFWDGRKLSFLKFFCGKDDDNDDDNETAPPTPAPAPTAPPTTLVYAVDSSHDGLYLVDSLSGDMVASWDSWPDYRTPVSMASRLNPADGSFEIYVINNSLQPDLLRVNHATGEATLIPINTYYGGALATYKNTLYMMLREHLYQLDWDTGADSIVCSAIVPTEIGYSIGGMDADPHTGLLYLVEISLSTALVYTVNPETCEFSTVGQMSENVGVVGSIVWNPHTGKFLGSSLQKGLFDLDLDGTVSSFRDIWNPFPISPQGMAFQPSTVVPYPSPTTSPTNNVQLQFGTGGLSQCRRLFAIVDGLPVNDAGFLCLAIDPEVTDSILVSYTMSNGWLMQETFAWFNRDFGKLPSWNDGQPKLEDFPYQSYDNIDPDEDASTHGYALLLEDIGVPACQPDDAAALPMDQNVGVPGSSVLGVAFAALFRSNENTGEEEEAEGWVDGVIQSKNGDFWTLFNFTIQCVQASSSPTPSEPPTAESAACSMDLFTCPDGTEVGRNPHDDCAFFPCSGSCANGSAQHNNPLFKDFKKCYAASDCNLPTECCIHPYCFCGAPDDRSRDCVAQIPPTGTNIRSIVAPVALQGGAEWVDPELYTAKAITWLEKDTFSQTLSDARIQQRYALACIYFATYAVRTIYTVVEPRGWIDSRGWVTDVDECTWFGLTCNATSEVEKIVLPSNRITGSFPAETTIIKNSITRIDLFRNSVYNTGDEGNAWLGELANLRELFYGQTNFEYNGIPPQIGQLTNLVEYDCSVTRYFGPLHGSTFAPLTNLEYLVLSGNAYNTSIPVEIGQLPNLQFLYVQNAFVDGDLSFMEPMQSILECWVDQNPGLGGTIPASIGSIQSLQSWSITRCGFTGPIPPELGNLRNMVRMWLYDNMLTGPVPAELGNLFKLQTLAVEENLLTGVMPQDICLNRVPLGLLQTLEADCAGNPPEIVCDCCTCCETCLPALAQNQQNGYTTFFEFPNNDP